MEHVFIDAISAGEKIYPCPFFSLTYERNKHLNQTAYGCDEAQPHLSLYRMKLKFYKKHDDRWSDGLRCLFSPLLVHFLISVGCKSTFFSIADFFF